MPASPDLRGQRFGRLVVIKSTRFPGKKGLYWECQCDCGNVHFAQTYNLKSGDTQSCGCFRKERAREATQLTYEYVKTFFEQRGCELLSKTYHRVDEKLLYRCECGNVSQIRFNNFRTGQRCKQCGINKTRRVGPDNPNWKHGKTDEERLTERKFKEYGDWRKQVFDSQPNVCCVCGTKTWLQAHHIYSWANHRNIRLDPKNGAILCKPCHDQFHNAYGKGYNTPEQLQEFKVNKELYGIVPASPHMKRRRNSKLLSFNGEVHSITEWADIVDMPSGTLFYRYKAGWGIEKILTTPIAKWGKSNRQKGGLNHGTATKTITI